MPDVEGHRPLARPSHSSSLSSSPECPVSRCRAHLASLRAGSSGRGTVSGGCGHPSTEQGWRGGLRLSSPLGMRHGQSEPRRSLPRHPQPDMNLHLAPAIRDSAGNALRDEALRFLHTYSHTLRCGREDPTGHASGSRYTPLRPEAMASGVSRIGHSAGPGASATPPASGTVLPDRPHGHLRKATGLRAFFQKLPSLATKHGPLRRLL